MRVHMHAEIIKREKKTGRPHLTNLKNVFCLKKKLNCLFFSFFRPNILTDKPAMSLTFQKNYSRFS